MKEKIENKLISGKAFQVFRTELRKHLSSSELLILGSTEALDVASLKRLSASFHTIRGGSGFFGLSEVAHLSEQLEELFGKENFDIKKDLDSAKTIFLDLKNCTTKILTES